MSNRPAASVLTPAGLEAAALDSLNRPLLMAGGLLFVVTMLLLAAALRPGRRRRWPAHRPARWWLIGGGLVLPLLVLAPLLLASSALLHRLAPALAEPDLVVGVTGRSWWWQLQYTVPGSGRMLWSANELRLPLGRTAVLGLQSPDLLHSLWVPALGAKVDLVPGRVNRMVVTPQRVGVFRGQCAEYCGTQHAHMALHVVVMPAEAFDRWLAHTADTPSSPDGLRLFQQQGCAGCHALDRHAAEPALGPNLAGIGSRLHLGAGVLRNDAESRLLWLREVQRLKPGAQMPSYHHLDAATLQALADFLGTLR